MNQQRPRGSRPSLPATSNGTLGAIVAVVALVLGFLILNDVRAETGSGVSNNTQAPTNTDGTGGDAGSTTTQPVDVRGFTIQVANASGVAGSAGKMTTDLQAQNFVVRPAVNVTAGTAKRKTTGVFYLAGCEANAQSVAKVLGGSVEVAVMPVPVPIETGNLADACILILLGTDLAGKPLAGVVGTGSGQAATTLPPAGGTTIP